jgi:hypothetical protein
MANGLRKLSLTPKEKSVILKPTIAVGRRQIHPDFKVKTGTGVTGKKCHMPVNPESQS